MPQLDITGSVIRDPIKTVSDPTVINITTANTDTAIVASADVTRKATVVHNTGTSLITVKFGLITTDQFGAATQKQAYVVHLPPDTSYLSDFPELVPLSATTTSASGSLTLVELR